MRFLPINLNAFMVELEDLEQTLTLLDSLNTEEIIGVEELIPAARTIMVKFKPEIVAASDIIRDISQRDLSARSSHQGILIEIPVTYDGEDLVEVAQILNTTTEEVIRRHTESQYKVAFTGFAPGFAYLTGGHPDFDIPRRAVPRTRIPEGAVGLAGKFSGVYPQASPGGWQIIGVTKARMWDLARAVPALLQPGFRVRFIDDRTLSPEQEAALLNYGGEDKKQVENLHETASSSELSPEAVSFKIESSGIQTTLQDLGRLHKTGQGVSASGALDQSALKTANRLVGNHFNTACLENVYGGLKFLCKGYTVVAVTGADVPIKVITLEGREIQFNTYQPIELDDGDRLLLGTPKAGVRTYISVRGGFNIQPILDSLSTDTLANIGPKPIAMGDVLPINPAPHSNAVEMPQERPYVLPKTEETITLDIVLGPRTDWFTTEAVDLLRTQQWQVTQQSNRVGIRLLGETPLERAIKTELPSEGTSIGAIQVPSSGQPVLFLADHPLTGGYPVIGTVATYHLDRAAQIPVNSYIRFNPITEFRALT